MSTKYFETTFFITQIFFQEKKINININVSITMGEKNEKKQIATIRALMIEIEIDLFEEMLKL